MLADDSGIVVPALGGAPGVRSARYAGPSATDQENLDKLLADMAGEDDRRAAYVCVLALVEPDGSERLFEGRCEGRLVSSPRGSGGFGYDPAFVPDDLDGSDRTMAEITPGREGRDQPPRPGGAQSRRGAGRGRRERARAGGATAPRHRRAPLIAPAALEGSTKFGAARLSIVSNSILIALKVAAGAITGSIAIITEAVHSSIDLLASIVAYLSLRKADEPADADHMYGHAKAENLAAAIEGMLILVGAGVILYESVHRLVAGGEIENIGVGIAVIGFSAVVNVVVSTYLYRQARMHDSPALEGDAAHLRADAATSVAVLVGLVLIEVTGVQELDAIVALMVGSAIVYAGVRILTRSSRVLMDEALPADELDVVREQIAEFPGARAGRVPQAARSPCGQRAPHRPSPPVRSRAPHSSGRTPSRTSCRRRYGRRSPARTCWSTPSRRGGRAAAERGRPSGQIV